MDLVIHSSENGSFCDIFGTPKRKMNFFRKIRKLQKSEKIPECNPVLFWKTFFEFFENIPNSDVLFYELILQEIRRNFGEMSPIFNQFYKPPAS